MAGFVRAVFASALLCAVAVVVPAASVSASASSDPGYPNSTLHVTVTGPRGVSRTLTVVATGSNAADSLSSIVYYLDVFVVHSNQIQGPCDERYMDEVGLHGDNPGPVQVLTPWGNEPSEGYYGSFHLRVHFTPLASGPLLVCTYSVMGLDTAAHSSTAIRIAPSSKG
jgi:hypothetical protein